MLVYLGIFSGHLVPVSTIADSYGISYHHLLKVANNLAAGRYIEAVRANGGGVRLARHAQDINIGEVVRYTEVDLGLVECFCPGSTCVIAAACLLRPVLRQALQGFLEALSKHTLGDLLKARPLFEELFGFTTPRGRASEANG
jgi:Rrf2 family nitric oxide-sensitive transcriptional repressor